MIRYFHDFGWECPWDSKGGLRDLDGSSILKGLRVGI